MLQLAEALNGNESLKVLDIGGNNIGPEGIKVLLEALRGNDTLRNLELGYNPIGEEGAKHLADVIKYDLAVRNSFQCLAHSIIMSDASLLKAGLRSVVLLLAQLQHA